MSSFDNDEYIYRYQYQKMMEASVFEEDNDLDDDRVITYWDENLDRKRIAVHHSNERNIRNYY